jgi:hypothetical protein
VIARRSVGRIGRVAALAAVVATAAIAQLRVAFLERPHDAASSAPAPLLGEVAAEAFPNARPLFPAAKKGDLPLDKVDLLFVGSFFATPKDAASAVFARRRESLRSFLKDGGTAFLFAQSRDRAALEESEAPDLKKAEERALWSFAAPEFSLTWTAQQRDAVVALDPGHPLATTPHVVAAEDVASGKGAKAVATDSPLGGPGLRAIFGHRYKLAYPWLSEVAIGKGRLILCGGAPDLPSKTSGEASRALLRKLVDNAAAYAEVVKARKAPPFEPTFATLPTTTKEAVVDFEDRAGFEARVSSAVDRGVAALRKLQKQDGTFGEFKTSFGAENYSLGQTALCVAALIASGVSKHDEAIVRAAATFPATAPRDTYQAGLLACALEYLSAPDGERFDLARLPPSERAAFVFKRSPTPERMATIRSCVDFLSGARHRGFWRYLDGPIDADLSASQYAAIGLAAARRCGADVPPDVFDRVLTGLLATQVKGKDRTYAFPRRDVGPELWPEFEETKKPVGFWNYEAPERATWGRGTPVAVAIAMATIALDDVSRGGMRDRRAPKVAAAIDLAFNYLDSTFRVDIQPCDPGRPIDHHPDFYFLYALERAATLTETRFIGRHDWYREAAEFLCDVQRKNGEWDVAGAQFRSAAIHTSFALLVLKRAAIPTRVTPR